MDIHWIFQEAAHCIRSKSVPSCFNQTAMLVKKCKIFTFLTIILNYVFPDKYIIYINSLFIIISFEIESQYVAQSGLEFTV